MAALILEIMTRGLHRYVEINKPVTTVGRALDNDIILSDPTVAPHHLRIVRHADDSLELTNLADVNPTRIDSRVIDALSIQHYPVMLEIGRVRAQLLPRDHPVAATRSIAANRSRGNIFGRSYWAVLLVLLCLLFGGLDFYLNAYSSFKWSELIKYVLRNTVLTIGSFVLAMSILERLLVNRWEIKQLITTVSLMYLLYLGVVRLADGLDYLLSANWPSTLFFFSWYLAAVPAAIGLYLMHISHLPRERSVLLALLIASPLSLPAILQSAQMQSLFDNFSNAASYHNQLSSVDWRFRDSVDIEVFIEQARQLEAGKPAD